MSEWGIEQHSTFGNCGGCFVEGLIKIEAVKFDTVVNSPDTVVFNGIVNQR